MSDKADNNIFKIILTVLAFLVALLGLAFSVFNGLVSRMDAQLQNERNERINQDNRLDRRIDEIRGRR